ncbi:MAG: hypothetical protein ACRCTS_10265 [Fusobacteriaceae bacterium]
MLSIIITLLISFICSIISTGLGMLIAEKINTKSIYFFGIIQPTINFFSVILFVKVFGLGLVAIFLSFIIVQTCFSIYMYGAFKLTIPPIYYDMCKEDGACPIRTFVLPVYIGKVKVIFATNFIMIYNEYFISKSMALKYNLIQDELVRLHSNIIYDGYFNFYLTLFISVAAILPIMIILNKKGDN